ncbi:MAG TPA: TAT-variant-translocated molybdopterin oxidoreductase [Bryobacteraceae bacterium]|nr:TAT-variant-translocated molybdopterin oxidoreductase [Bryobacteraceae bacterium]
MSLIQITRGGMDLAAIRERLGQSQGRRYWRGLEELAETREFRALLENEFAPGVTDWDQQPSRRRMLHLLGASLGLAGLTACTKQPPEKIVPYVRAPEDVIPGKPLYFATAMTLGGLATGVLVESHMGRPTKIEGNPQHPASLGATDVFAQASVLTLYDPDRSQVVTKGGRISTWVSFVAEVSRVREALLARKGAGFRILTQTVSSPTLAAQLGELLREMPEAVWHQYETCNRDEAREGARLAFGEAVQAVYRLEEADVILALDADLLGSGPGAVRYAREFARRRRPYETGASINRLYVAEPAPTVTGAAADHRLPLPAGEIEHLARAVAAAVGLNVAQSGTSAPAGWIKAVAEDLRKHGGRSLVVAGDQQPAIVHALAHAINDALGNSGRTVVYVDPPEARPAAQMASLKQLVEDMQAGRVETLLILGANPVYDAPADLEFARHFRNVGLRIHLGLYEDETAAQCHWHVPEAHYLEAWSDARAFEGTVTIVQPLIAPLYGGKSAHEMVAAFSGKPDRAGYDIVREHWRQQYRGADFEEFWQRALHDGVVPGTALPPKKVSLRREVLAVPPSPRGEGIEICFRPDPTIWDGRFANNGWLQELPKPLTKLTWDNAALVSPRLAERLGLANEEVVELRCGGASVEAPVWIVPGCADNSVTVHLGYGRTRAGKVAAGAGFDANRIRSAAAPWRRAGLEIRRTGRRRRLAVTQEHHSMEGRNLVRAATLREFHDDPHFAHHGAHEPAAEMSLYPGFRYEGYSWGMAIDLNACIGCGACVVACQAENNIPVVGRREVARGREMHWIRVDRYFEGGLDDPDIHHQPVPCMHCDQAPCEVVCPTGATTHSAEGLNQMTYNRCVGTRYCSNNCPYKVRRFNFFLYADWATESLKALRNPDVTVRSRGVMEKCTYCVQRINEARIEAEKQGRRIRDGEVVTACQAACPTEAIVFGDLNDPASRVARLKAQPLNYGILTELNTRPRTTYLARVRNPNPELERG